MSEEVSLPVAVVWPPSPYPRVTVYDGYESVTLKKPPGVRELSAPVYIDNGIYIVCHRLSTNTCSLMVAAAVPGEGHSDWIEVAPNFADGAPRFASLVAMRDGMLLIATSATDNEY